MTDLTLLLRPAHTPSWRDSAACLAEDPELFFPIGTSGPALRQIEQAKAVCRRCPVADRCLQAAMKRPAYEDHGVWGGLSETERHALREAASEAEKAAATVTQLPVVAATGGEKVA